MDTSTDLSILMTEKEWQKVLDAMPDGLRKAGYTPANISAEIISSTCEPDNVLVNEYVARTGRIPAAEHIWRVIVNGTTDLPLHKATSAVAGCLPQDAYWYGTSEIGHTEFGLGSSCAWQG